MAGKNIFDVDKLLEHRKSGSSVEYLVRWKGYGPEQDSWEPEKNLQNCHAEMAKFKKTASPPKTPTRSKTPTRPKTPTRSKTPTRAKTPTRSKTPTRTRSRSRTRAMSKSPTRTPKASPSKLRSTSRTRSKSRTRQSESVTVKKQEVKVAAKLEDLSPPRPPRTRSRSVTRKTTTTTLTTTTTPPRRSVVTTTTTPPRRSTVTTTTTPPRRSTRIVTSSVTAAGDASSSKSLSSQLHPVVVPRSLQSTATSTSATGKKGEFLGGITCTEILIVLILTAVIVTAAAHHWKLIDLNEMVDVVKANLPQCVQEYMGETTQPPVTTRAPPTVGKP